MTVSDGVVREWITVPLAERPNRHHPMGRVLLWEHPVLCKAYRSCIYRFWWREAKISSVRRSHHSQKTFSFAAIAYAKAVGIIRHRGVTNDDIVPVVHTFVDRGKKGVFARRRNKRERCASQKVGKVRHGETPEEERRKIFPSLYQVVVSPIEIINYAPLCGRKVCHL